METTQQPEVSPPTNKKVRLLSIDALRGFDMFWILGAEGLFAALFVLTGLSFFNVAAAQMLHSTWHGFTAYDLIFPLFIFLSGVSLGLAAKPMSAYSPDKAKQIRSHAHKRLALLLVFGVLYNHGWGTGMPASLDDVRFASVLGRIGIAWYVAAMLVWNCQERTQWLVAGGILLAYWLLLSFVEIGGYGAGDFSATGSLNVWFDQTFLPGATYKNAPMDPEGLLSNLTSIVNALFGVFAGRHMGKLKHSPMLLLKHLVGAGVLAIALAYAWDVIFPVNKSLWTSSFVLLTTGWSLLLLALFYYVIDVIKWQRWAAFFAVIGMNSIIVYLGTSLVNWSYTAKSLFGGLIAVTSHAWQPLLLICAILAIQWCLLYWLYRQKIFIKV